MHLCRSHCSPRAVVMPRAFNSFAITRAMVSRSRESPRSRVASPDSASSPMRSGHGTRLVPLCRHRSHPGRITAAPAQFDTGPLQLPRKTKVCAERVSASPFVG